jgi:hypothetical protein
MQGSSSASTQTSFKCNASAFAMISLVPRALLVVITLMSGSCFGFQAPDAQAILKRTLDVVGFSKTANQVLHWRDTQGVEQDYQSSPPFLTMFNSRESWFDAETGVERIVSQLVFPGAGAAKPSTTLAGPRAIFAIRDSGPVRVAGSPGQQRNLNLWAVLSDWRDAHDVRPGPDEVFQDYPRTVLTRAGEYGEERLFIDPKTGFPVKLDREEPHYLWGQVRVEYIYSIWEENGGITLPAASARVVDGFKEITRTIGGFDFVERAKAPELSLPAGGDVAGNTTPMFLQPLPPKKVEATPRIFLSVNPGYTDAFALIGNTIYVFDATQAEARAKQDLELIRTTFPGDHPIVLVVTDTAWPHVAGVRFWVASGATVISHRTSKEFLTRVIDRRWTRSPDLLEQHRKSIKFKFVSVDKSYVAAEGKLQLVAIDGIGSEGALMAYLPDDRFLWASDYIQSVSRSTAYTNEVWQAVQRAEIEPRQVAAQHIPLTSWSAIESLVKGGSILRK